MWGDMLCWILACIGVVIIMGALCLVAAICAVAVPSHGLWSYVLGWLLFLIGVTIVLHIIEWALPRWDNLFEEGEVAGKE